MLLSVAYCTSDLKAFDLPSSQRQMKKLSFSLCGLCGSSEAGGYYSPIYPYGIVENLKIL
jgi:hypothetical protein